MKNILLYSGGLDSLCAKTILEKKIKFNEIIYFKFKTPYVDKEIEKIKKYNKISRNKVRIVNLKFLNGSGFSDIHIPFRNLLLIILSSVKYLKSGSNERINIYIPQVLELGRDKNTLFFNLIEFISNHVYNYNIRIKRPFNTMNKYQLVKKSGLSLSLIEKYSYSCYNGSDTYDDCYGCRERETALYRAGLINKKPKPYIRELIHHNWKLFSLIYIFDLIKILRIIITELRWKWTH